MKTKRYIITDGQYDNYRIVAHLEGPVRPALSTLYKQFCLHYDILKARQNMDTYLGISGYIDSKYKAQNRLHEEGYTGGLCDCFVQWLKLNHQFVDIEINEFYLGF